MQLDILYLDELIVYQDIVMVGSDSPDVPAAQPNDIHVINVGSSGIPTVKTKELNYPPRDAVAMFIAMGIVGTFAAGVVLCFAFTFLVIFHPVTETKTTESGGKIEKVTTTNSSTMPNELFKTLSAIMSGPLGFVLGFYFRETQSNKNP